MNIQSRMRLNFRKLMFDQEQHLQGEWQSPSGWEPFHSPLGLRDLAELTWYLEQWSIWPTEPDRNRAQRLLEGLHEWGHALYTSIGRPPLTTQSYIEIKTETHSSAAAALHALPWELIGLGTEVGSRLPLARLHQFTNQSSPTIGPLRVLVVLSRPDEGWIDPRVSLTPLLDVLAEYGDAVDITVLEPATLAALSDTLRQAQEHQTPFTIVHFDGHGIWNAEGGGLVFEDPLTANLDARWGRLESVEDIIGALRPYRIPLLILEACQTGHFIEDQAGSLALALLDSGAEQILAMTHKVLVDTSRRIVSAIYSELLSGASVDVALSEARCALAATPRRSAGVHSLDLQDWMVPVLYRKVTPTPVVSSPLQRRTTPTVPLPELPTWPYQFVGRGRLLVSLLRRFRHHPGILLTGPGGIGKTRLAVEFAHWLVAIGRVQRIFWINVEVLGSTKAIEERLAAHLGRILDITPKELEEALGMAPTLILVDNFETAIQEGSAAQILNRLHDLSRTTLVLATSREGSFTLPTEWSSAEVPSLSVSEGRELLRATLSGESLPSQQGLEALIAATGGHPRSLELLAPLLLVDGVAVTTKTLSAKMADLENQYPGHREKSLLASAALSLRRLQADDLQDVSGLGVFHGAAHVMVLAHVCDVSKERALELAAHLVRVGLASLEGPWLCFEPALPLLLQEHIPDLHAAQTRWLEATSALVIRLYGHRFADDSLTQHGVQLASAEWLALTERIPELPMETARAIGEGLSALLRPFGASALKERLERMLEVLPSQSSWSHASFLQFRSKFEQLMSAGATAEAAQLAEERLATSDAAAFEEAPFDQAIVRLCLGRARKDEGRNQEALELLHQAREQFDVEGQQIAVCWTEIGDVERAEGRLQRAEAAYQAAQRSARARKDHRQVVVSTANLANVFILQQRYDAALQAWQVCREAFEARGEPRMIATAWHQMGIVHQYMGALRKADQSFRQAYLLHHQCQDQQGMLDALLQLGTVQGRGALWLEAARYYRAAIEHAEKLGAQLSLARAWNNLADALHHLGHLNEARESAYAAIHLKESLSSTAQPWTSWAIVEAIERSANDLAASRKARQRAMALYEEWRIGGGQPHDSSVALVGKVLHELLAGRQPTLPPANSFSKEALPLRRALLHIIEGSRDFSIAEDPALDFAVAVELRAVLRQLQDVQKSLVLDSLEPELSDDD